MSDELREFSQYWAEYAKFAGCEIDCDPIARVSRRMTLKRGQNLISQGDVSQTVFLLVRGALKAVWYSENGHEIWLSSFKPTALIGEMSGLTDAPRSSTVVCEEEATVLVVDFSDFRKQLLQDPNFSFALTQLLARRLKDTSTQLEELATLQTSARLHSELVRLGTFQADDDEVALIANPLSVSEMAVRIHAARESTSRAFSFLQRRGLLIKQTDGTFNVIAPKNRI